MKRLLLMVVVIVLLIVPVSAAEDLDQDADLVDQRPAYDTYTTYVLDDVSGSDAQGEDTAQLPAVLVALFGEYRPRTQTVTEYLSDGSSVTYQQVIPGVAGVDFVWIASVLLFALVLFCIFKLIGGLLKS